MASAVPNAWAWFRARVGHGAGAESTRSLHDVADRRRRREAPLASVSLGGAPDLIAELASTSAPAAVTREELGRATWLFLHTLAAQFPDDPTRQQEKDARDLIHILTRAYPCEVCAAHFAEIVKRNPPDTSSGMALQQWACAAHNEVNASLGKPAFDCAAVASRWAGLDCGGDDEDGCSLENRRAKGRGGGGGASEGGGRARIDTY